MRGGNFSRWGVNDHTAPMARANAPGNQTLHRVGREGAGQLGRPPERGEIIGLHEHGSSRRRPRTAAARAARAGVQKTTG